jgi:sec-independent protein translocase protein TatA
MGELSPWHWMIVAFVFTMLFGAKKLPEVARSLGQSLRVLKTELDGGRRSAETAPAATVEASPLTPAPASTATGDGTATPMPPTTRS